MSDCIVVLNCDSSSIKFVLFDTNFDPSPRAPMWDGIVEGIGTGHPTATEADASTQVPELDAAQPYHAMLMHIRQRVGQKLKGRRLKAVAYRVVHGDAEYFVPVCMNAGVLSDLRNYISLVPLHQPFILETIEALLLGLSDVPQTTCFDTAFYRTLPQVETMLLLPYMAREHSLWHYGFHGLSYEYTSIALPERHGGIARGRAIAIYLDSGVNLCAAIGLKNIATMIGSSALEGLMMGTWCGSLDPGVVFYMMEMEHLSPTQVGHVLYHESGLFDVSGLSPDPRDLVSREADSPRVQTTLVFYVCRIIREIGALVAVLGSLDLLIFTVGIGERNAILRKRIVRGPGYLDASLNGEADQAHVAITSNLASRIHVTVEPASEERVIA